MPDVPNNLDNTYYQGKNHIRLARSERNRSVIFDAAVQRATQLGKTIASGARSGGTLVQPDFFVDSVAGDDLNAGTEAAPFQTLAKAETEALAFGNGVVIGLVAGSHWREGLDLSTLDNVTIQGVGDLATNGLPIVRGDDVASSTWDDSTDRADANTAVYSQTITFDTGTSEMWLAVWEDDVRLSWAASVAACQAAPGSFHISGAGTQNGATSPAILYVHPFGSTAPTGKVFEFTSREKGVFCQGAASTMKFIYARRCGHNLGNIVAGHDALIEGCIADGGVRHQINAQSGAQIKCVGWVDHDDSRGGHIALEFVTADGSGKTCAWDRCVVVSTAAAGAIGGIGGHASGVGTEYDAWTATDCAFSGTTIGANETDTFTVTRPNLVNGGWSVNVPVFAVVDPWLKFDAATYPTVNLMNFNIVPTGSITGLRAYLNSTPLPATSIINLTGFTGNFSLLNSIIVEDGGSVRRRPIFATNTGSVTVRNTILDSSRGTSAAGQEFRYRFFNGGGRVTTDNTYFPATANFMGANISGVGAYNDATSYLAAVQPGGEEAGTVIADPQLADPANGDFTVGGSGLSAGVGVNDPTCQNYTPIPASIAAAEAWILS